MGTSNQKLVYEAYIDQAYKNNIKNKKQFLSHESL